MLPEALEPHRITDLLDNIDLYLEEMRKTELQEMRFLRSSA